MTSPTPVALRRTALAGALLLALSACSGGSDDVSEPDLSPEVSTSTSDGADGGSGAEGPEVRTDDSDDFADQRYVAMGDSYTSAPGVAPVDNASGLCARSTINYPSLVQGAYGGSELADVSCSGATTADLLAPQTLGDGTTVPAQIDAVTPDTDVVTMSTGGNDFGAFALLAGSCSAGSCPDLTLESAQEGLAGIETDLAAAIRAVQERAPEARVLVVGYPQVAPATEGCDALPVTPEEVGLVRLLNSELANAQRRAAEAAGVEFVDLFAATEGHALCSEEPWINDDSPAAAPYHPLPPEQRAAAAALVELLDA
ncbi:SGNH/GDSL hydrolase family protein [Nocardioides zeae]|uniref:SGNH/GDSL hydrolase family protein n=1 Tax=Nocardioides imazamoxiresistens TaxID=3231893 RepID=A0ABU3PWV8_9ACTN|nr:SGNH/GDSL hydrolase family protein [Nocardioides zeae]MDT9593322.1 SGNH/GDSL hydrolase family protein [Nocardioides zeae]